MLDSALAEKAPVSFKTARALAGQFIHGPAGVLNAADSSLGRRRLFVSVILGELPIGKLVASLPLALLAAQPFGRHGWCQCNFADRSRVSKIGLEGSLFLERP